MSEEKLDQLMDLVKWIAQSQQQLSERVEAMEQAEIEKEKSTPENTSYEWQKVTKYRITRQAININEKSEASVLAGSMDTYSSDWGSMQATSHNKIYRRELTDIAFDTVEEAHRYLSKRDPNWQTTKTRWYKTFTHYT